MNIIILGPQGSGKGTQAELLVEKYGYTYIETGEILREIAATNHPWGKRVGEMMKRGVLVSDTILNAVLKESLAQAHPRGFLFDGTPRNFSQYNLIKNTLSGLGEKIDKVVFIDISQEETTKRLTSRRTCKRCDKIYNLITNPPRQNDRCDCGGELFQREDDFPEAIRKRLEAFHKSTSGVIKTAEQEGILIKINGEQPIEKIHEEIVEKLRLTTNG